MAIMVHSKNSISIKVSKEFAPFQQIKIPNLGIISQLRNS